MSRLTDLIQGLPQPKEAAPQSPAAPPRDTPLSPAAEARRRKALAMLARDGGRYAVAVDDAGTDPIIMALATPDGTCELRIPRHGYDPFAIAAMVAGWNREAP